jgi:hypothetical protein
VEYKLLGKDKDKNCIWLIYHTYWNKVIYHPDNTVKVVNKYVPRNVVIDNPFEKSFDELYDIVRKVCTRGCYEVAECIFNF